jgi:hypothetical protein
MKTDASSAPGKSTVQNMYTTLSCFPFLSPLLKSRAGELNVNTDSLNPDSYNFTAECPHCNEKRGVSCSREQAKSVEPIKVYAIQCDHSWTLSAENSKMLRENSMVLAS